MPFKFTEVLVRLVPDEPELPVYRSRRMSADPAVVTSRPIVAELRNKFVPPVVKPIDRQFPTVKLKPFVRPRMAFVPLAPRLPNTTSAWAEPAANKMVVKRVRIALFMVCICLVLQASIVVHTRMSKKKKNIFSLFFRALGPARGNGRGYLQFYDLRAVSFRSVQTTPFNRRPGRRILAGCLSRLPPTGSWRFSVTALGAGRQRAGGFQSGPTSLCGRQARRASNSDRRRRHRQNPLAIGHLPFFHNTTYMAL